MPFSRETERLHIRAFREEDAEVFAAYRSDPDVARYQSWDPPVTLEQARRFTSEMAASHPGTLGEWYQIALERKEDGAVIGDCAFHIYSDEGLQAEIGFTLARAYQGKGYAAEAVQWLLGYLFAELHLHRVQATCDVDNLPSSRLLDRLGLRREAYFRENVWFKERWGSEYVYAILQEEWTTR
jgi:RimJ/RimL family protein N-acetyltransferase